MESDPYLKQIHSIMVEERFDELAPKVLTEIAMVEFAILPTSTVS